jgi:hypothetical protein
MDLVFDSTSAYSTDSRAATEIKDASCIIWDEAPSSHRFTLDVADKYLRDLCRTHKPFRVKTIILWGDWRQTRTLPVVTRGANAEQIAACLRMSALWPKISENTLILTRNMKGTNPLFADWLLDIRNEWRFCPFY